MSIEYLGLSSINGPLIAQLPTLLPSRKVALEK